MHNTHTWRVTAPKFILVSEEVGPGEDHGVLVGVEQLQDAESLWGRCHQSVEVDVERNPERNRRNSGYDISQWVYLMGI